MKYVVGLSCLEFGRQLWYRASLYDLTGSTSSQIDYFTVDTHQSYEYKTNLSERICFTSFSSTILEFWWTLY